MVTVAEATHPNASVTSTEFAPAHNAVAVAVVSPLLHK